MLSKEYTEDFLKWFGDNNRSSDLQDKYRANRRTAPGFGDRYPTYKEWAYQYYSEKDKNEKVI